MTIKEIEARAGLTRANIRFYEAEGLLCPRRLENGYRDYAEADLDALKRIRLLRALGISLEDIRALQSGEKALPDALTLRIGAMDLEREELDRAQAVCRALLGDGADYSTLDAQKYLDALEGGLPVPPTDAVREPRIPWQRYWARMFDLMLCSIPVEGAAALVLHAENLFAERSVLQTLLFAVLDMVLMVVLEPVFLSRLGTTPGKWIFGIRVTDPEGRRLTHEEALWRTVDVMARGLAFNVPFLHAYFLIRSYLRCDGGEPLPWEENSVLTVRDTKKWRYAVFALAYLGVWAVSIFAVIFSMEMPHRGGLTPAELSENYARAAKYYDADGLFTLSQDGTWTRIRTEEGVVYWGPGEELAPPPLRLEERDGIVTAVYWEGEAPMLLDTADMEACLICAFAGAREEKLLYPESRRAMDRLTGWVANGLSADIAGVHIECAEEFFDISVPTLTWSSEDMTYSSAELPQTMRRFAFSMVTAG